MSLPSAVTVAVIANVRPFCRFHYPRGRDRDARIDRRRRIANRAGPQACHRFFILHRSLQLGRCLVEQRFHVARNKCINVSLRNFFRSFFFAGGRCCDDRNRENHQQEVLHRHCLRERSSSTGYVPIAVTEQSRYTEANNKSRSSSASFYIHMAQTNTRRTELLAPAGDWESLRAAVANGADAVYFGLSDFNARHRATNFTLPELPEVMDYLHRHNVCGYVAFNTLIFSDELPHAVEFIAAIVAAGADAVIVQDLGLAKLVRRVAPGLAIHGSTQMTLTEPRGIEFVRKLGVERVIVARELSLDEIGRIAAQTKMELEVFVHGALCVAYSGQCLTSEALGGRSANRGQCAQACRLPYDLFVDGHERDTGDRHYLLSPQDLAAYDLVDPLVKLGVRSLKIEGRLKSAEYVAITSQTYRAALDAALSNQSFQVGAGAATQFAAEFLARLQPRFPRRSESSGFGPCAVSEKPRRAGGNGDRQNRARRGGRADR